MSWLSIIITTIQVFILSTIRYIDQATVDKYQNTFLLNLILPWISKHRFEIAVFAATFIVAYHISININQVHVKKIKARNLLNRINVELFGKDLVVHRVTLFKDMGYLKALIKHLIAFICHIFWHANKVKLYFRFPKKAFGQ